MILKGNTGLIATGKITRDPEAKTVGAKNSKMVKFGVAVGEKEYINVVCWRKIADYAEGLKKGDNVMLIGTEKSREYQGKTYVDVTAEFITTQADALPVPGELLDEPVAPSIDSTEDMQQIDEDMPF